MNYEPIIHVFSETKVLAEKLAVEFSDYVQRLLDEKELIFIALSGGNTPTAFFRALVRNSPNIDWSRIRLFWVDERCVPPDHPESNYGMAKKELLDPLDIPASSVFSVDGAKFPKVEAKAYSERILDIVSPELNFPVFDIVFLGMGDDGHTASIFPDQIDLWERDDLCAVGEHPITGQKRVTFTGNLINKASKIIFMVTGINKADIAKDVISRTGSYKLYPASLVNPHQGTLEWYMDKEAASGLT